MNTASGLPATLIEAVRYFENPDAALAFVVSLRWPDGVTCPHCENENPSFLKTRRIWKCRVCKRQFSVKVGTIFEDSPIGLDKWLPALWMLANCKNGISSYELARDLGVTQKTAWFMLHRIRLAMETKTFKKFSGEIEVDETYIGGLAKNMHRSRRGRMITSTGGKDKTAVLGVLERKKGKKPSRVHAVVTPTVRKRELQPHIDATVKPGSEVSTDALSSYRGLESRFVHSVIDHAYGYVSGRTHTNGLENFWSLLKRTVKGTYVSVDPGHLGAYVTEQVFRFNNRHGTDKTRFMDVVRSIIGRRLTYAALTTDGDLQTC